MKTKAEIEKEINPMVIFIAVADNTPEAALRIFVDEKKQQQKYYYSTRMGGVKRVKGGYAVEFNEHHLPQVIDKHYELVVLSAKRKVINGVIKIDSNDKTKSEK